MRKKKSKVKKKKRKLTEKAIENGTAKKEKRDKTIQQHRLNEKARSV